jgi:hypothetical protein
MNEHIQHLIVAYVHGQLGPRDRIRVLQHTYTCETCRAILDREIRVVSDLRAELPGIGLPRAGQMKRLWPQVWTHYQGAANLEQPLLQAVGTALAMLMLCLFVSTALFGGAAQANAAPLPPIPADVKATDTPVFTDTPQSNASPVVPSEAANLHVKPNASPVPVVGQVLIGH